MLIIFTPYNVGSVLWRLFSTLEVVQYIGGITSVLWGDSFSTVGDSFSTVEVVQYSGGITSLYYIIFYEPKVHESACADSRQQQRAVQDSYYGSLTRPADLFRKSGCIVYFFHFFLEFLA